MSIEVGAKLQGKVSGITNFGAFIDLGERKTGLVHISEVSNGFIKDIHDVLSVGDEVTVKVTSVGNDGKIGLSIRQATEQEEKPKKEFNRNHHEPREKRPSFDRNVNSRGGNRGNSRSVAQPKQDFDALMSSFLKDSDDRLLSLKRNTEGKRGGRGGRRN
ncbi:MAG: RNA-binding protein S1 [Lactobacillales bacterium]|jgi:S1 RNA binding domain protein|nr:RNA-binding protein S1 [Lactobacillales bacterium]